MNEDPRLGKPSASSFSIDALCPGRQDLLQSLPDVPEPKDEFADRGSKLHLAWQKEDPSGLDSEDTELYERGLKLVKEALDNWLNPFARGGQIQVKEGQREERFYLRDANGSIAASGQADRHWYTHTVHEKREGLLLDFKSLYNPNLTPAELNWQLLLLAVLVAKEYELNHIRCAFVKPMFNKLDIVDYNADDLKRAEYAVQQVLWSIKHTPQRRPGSHCRRCRGATACPEAKAWTLLPSVQLNALEGVNPTMAKLAGITPKMAVEMVEFLNLADCVKIHETATSRHNIEDAIAARLKSLSLGELAELGLTFGEPKINRPITFTAPAMQFLVNAGIPNEKLWQAVEFGKSKLTDIVQEHFKMTKKGAEQWIKDKLAPFITEKLCDRPLKKI